MLWAYVVGGSFWLESHFIDFTAFSWIYTGSCTVSFIPSNTEDFFIMPCLLVSASSLYSKMSLLSRIHLRCVKQEGSETLCHLYKMPHHALLWILSDHWHLSWKTAWYLGFWLSLSCNTRINNLYGSYISPLPLNMQKPSFDLIQELLL